MLLLFFSLIIWNHADGNIYDLEYVIIIGILLSFGNWIANWKFNKLLYLCII